MTFKSCSCAYVKSCSPIPQAWSLPAPVPNLLLETGEKSRRLDARLDQVHDAEAYNKALELAIARLYGEIGSLTRPAVQPDRPELAEQPKQPDHAEQPTQPDRVGLFHGRVPYGKDPEEYYG